MIMTIARMNIIMNITMVIMILMIIMIVKICACIGLRFLSVATNEICETYHCIDWVLKLQLKHRMWKDWTWQMTHKMSLWNNNIWGYESDMKQYGSVPKLGDFEDLRCRSNTCSSRCQDQKVGWNSPGSLPPCDEKTGSYPDRNFSGSSARNLLVGGISTMLHGFPRMIVLWIAGVVV